MDLYKNPKREEKETLPIPPRSAPVKQPVEPPPVATPPQQEEKAESAQVPSADVPADEPARTPPINEQEPPAYDLGELFAQHPQPPKRSYEHIFGQTYTDTPKEKELSAAEKFRNTMSNVSSGIFANVQKLPVNSGRIVTVSICVILLLAFIAWSVSALYKATNPAANAPVPEAAPRTESKIKPDSRAKDTAGGTQVKPGKLKSSGIEIPSLYID
jgi:hypothetical protein